MLKTNWIITIKHFIWLSLVILLFSCNNINKKETKTITKSNGISVDVGYFPTGEISYKDSLYYGKRHGLSLRYYKSGDIEEKTKWKNDTILYSVNYKENGDTTRYFLFENDSLLIEIVFKNGKRWIVIDRSTNEEITYDENGEVVRILPYYSDPSKNLPDRTL